MADVSIDVALEALENEVTWSTNLARCLVDASGRDGPAWVDQVSHLVSKLSARVEDLAQAIRAGDRGSMPQVHAARAGGARVIAARVSGQVQ
jgi:hypothetical protein